MSAICQIPEDIYSAWIFPNLTNDEMIVFLQASKATSKIVISVLRNSQTDLALSGERKKFQYSGPLSVFFLQRMKMIFLKNHPEFLTKLETMREDLTQSGKNIYDIDSFIRYAEEIRDVHFTLTLIPFDFSTTKKIKAFGECGLGNCLRKAVAIGDVKLAKMVLFHPNAEAILAEGLYSIGHAIEDAIQKGTQEFVEIFLTHPKAKEIEVEGQFGLINIINAAICMNYPDLVEKFLSLPNGQKFLLKEFSSKLAEQLIVAISLKRTEIVKVIRSHSNARNTIIGHDSLSGALTSEMDSNQRM